MHCRNWDPVRKRNGRHGCQPSGLSIACCPCGGAERRVRKRSHLLPERQSGGGHYPVERVQQDARRKEGMLRSGRMSRSKEAIYRCGHCQTFVCRSSRTESSMSISTKWPNCSTSMTIKMVVAGTYCERGASCED